MPSLSPRMVRTCPNCGNSQFTVGRGMYYCAPGFDEKKGCGWFGPREELILQGKTKKDQNKYEFNKKYSVKTGDAWQAFYNICSNRGWFQGTWNIPKDEAIQRLLKEGQLKLNEGDQT